MKLAVTFTVGHRFKYFEPVLDSWAAVRDKKDVLFYFSCEPSDWRIGDGGNATRAEKWIKDNGVVGRVYRNNKQFGVLKNPHTALQRAFCPQVDYAILAEDDLLVSDDIVEYHKWAANEYRNDREIAMVCSFFQHIADESLLPNVARVPNFASVWIWGTWVDRWFGYISPTWDHDYSTGDEQFPGGWDWNLNKRVLPKLEKKSIVPLVSRSQNIGIDGTHAVDARYHITAPSFELSREKVEFSELG